METSLLGARQTWFKPIHSIGPNLPEFGRIYRACGLSHDTKHAKHSFVTSQGREAHVGRPFDEICQRLPCCLASATKRASQAHQCLRLLSGWRARERSVGSSSCPGEAPHCSVPPPPAPRAVRRAPCAPVPDEDEAAAPRAIVVVGRVGLRGLCGGRRLRRVRLP